MGSETVLVPVRFLVTFTHLLACVMVSYTSDENVMRGLGLDHWFGTHSSSVEAKAEIDWLAASATALYTASAPQPHRLPETVWCYFPRD